MISCLFTLFLFTIVEGDPLTPGVARGPCPTSSGVPSGLFTIFCLHFVIYIYFAITEVEEQQADATVTWSNIGYGPIGSTFKMNI